jgi:hypothetical protein
MPNELREQTETLLTESTLPAEDQQLWREVLGNSPEMTNHIFVKVVSANPELLQYATENLKLKLGVFAGEVDTETVYEQERKALEAVASTELLEGSR